jgi:hypothetical protein
MSTTKRPDEIDITTGSLDHPEDKPRQGVVANTLNAFRDGAVGFIDLLGESLLRMKRRVMLVSWVNVDHRMRDLI